MNCSTRLCIAGKNQIAVDILDRALALPALEITVLPVKDDSGVDDWQPSLSRAATRAGVEIVTLDWAMAQPDLTFLSLEYDRLIAPDGFRSKRLFNIHFSLLPKYRGCFTSIWPILRGEAEHGVTLHWINAGMDTGPIIDQASFPLAKLTAREAYFRCMDLGRDLVASWLNRLLAGDPPATAQHEQSASSFRRRDLDFSLARIDLSQTVGVVMARIRAFTFSEYQLPTFNGQSIIAANLVENAPIKLPGTINHRSGSVARVWLSDGVIDLSLTGREGAIKPPFVALDCPPMSRPQERRA